MRIGIVGASGNIGSRVLVEARTRGHEVIAFTRRGAAARPAEERSSGGTWTSSISKG